MKIWTPKEGFIYTFNKSLSVRYSSIVIDKVVGYANPVDVLFFSFNLEGVSDMLYCKGENFQSFKEALDPQTVKVEYNMTLREAKMIHALKVIERWREFPDTGLFYDRDNTQKMSYGAAYGSNGERDYMRKIAREALEVNL